MDRSTLIGLNHHKNKDGILVIEAPSHQKANEITLEIISKYSDQKTALFLSGGSTPKRLYEMVASEKNLKAGAVGMIDERYKPNSIRQSGGQNSKLRTNESMIRETGLIEYFDNTNTRFYPILGENTEIEDTASQYDEALRFIFKYFPKSVGVLGVGEDGHTAGIPAIPEIVVKMEEDQSSLVDFYEAEKYGARITLNFQGLSMLDLIVILVLGQGKREALAQMFKEGSTEDIPARFYLKPTISPKVVLITDQII